MIYIVKSSENEYTTALKDIRYNGKIMSSHKLNTGVENMRLNEWRYLQLKYFVRFLPQPIWERLELSGKAL